MKFNVDMTILGEKIVDSTLAYSMYIPKSFVPVGDSVLTLIKQKSEVENSLSSVKIMVSKLDRLFMDSTTQSFISILEMQATPESYDSTKKIFLERLRTQIDSSSLMTSDFNLNSAKITQCLIQLNNNQSESKVIFKLLIWLPNKKVMQLDYVIPKRHYTDKIAKAIESSIGSFNSFFH